MFVRKYLAGGYTVCGFCIFYQIVWCKAKKEMTLNGLFRYVDHKTVSNERIKKTTQEYVFFFSCFWSPDDYHRKVLYERNHSVRNTQKRMLCPSS